MEDIIIWIAARTQSVNTVKGYSPIIKMMNLLQIKDSILGLKIKISIY